MVTMMSQDVKMMHTESENYDFLMYTLNAGQPVHPYIPSTTVLGDTLCDDVLCMQCVLWWLIYSVPPSVC